MGGTSVLIATKDRPHALRRCLLALASGARAPTEIVVIDQSGDERSREVVDHCRGSMRIAYARHAGGGLGAAQNFGCSLSTGDVLAVTDDDCIADPAWLERVESAFRRWPDLAALCGRVVPLPPVGERTSAVASRTSTDARRFEGRALPWNVGSGNNFAVRREWFARIGGCDERLGPGAAGRGAVDLDLFYRLLRAGGIIRYDPECLVHHERASRAGRLARRLPYGYGMGACCAFALLDGDRFSGRLLAGWLALRGRALAAGALKTDRVRVHEELLILAGTMRGSLHPLRLVIAGPKQAPRRRLKQVHRRPVGVRGVILLYHRVAEPALDPWDLAVRPEHFDQQLEMLRRCFAPAHVDALVGDRPEGGRLPVAITFDDGYHDNLTAALPALERARWPATFFIAGHGDVEDFWWDVLARLVLEAPARPALALPLPGGSTLHLRLDEPPPSADRARSWRATDSPSHPRFAAYLRCWRTLRDLRPVDRDRAMEPVREAGAALFGGESANRRLSDAEVAGVGQSPLARLGAHTLSHPRLSVLGADDRRKEITGSRRRLERVIGGHVSAFSYPFGAREDYGRAAVRVVREAGYQLACSSAPGVVDARASRLELPRLFVRDMPGDALERRLLRLVRTGA